MEKIIKELLKPPTCLVRKQLKEPLRLLSKAKTIEDLNIALTEIALVCLVNKSALENRSRPMWFNDCKWYIAVLCRSIADSWRSLCRNCDIPYGKRDSGDLS